MKVYLYLIFLILVSSFVLAEKQQMVYETNVTVNIIGWDYYDNITNKTRTYVNVTIKTEDDTRTYNLLTNTSNINSAFDTNLVRYFDCNETDLINLTRSTYNACVKRVEDYNNYVGLYTNCTTGWSICKNTVDNKSHFEYDYNQCRLNLSSMDGIQNQFDSCESSKINLQTEKVNCETANKTCTTELDKKKGLVWIYAIAGILIGWQVVPNVMKRFGGSITEREGKMTHDYRDNRDRPPGLD